MNSFTPGLKTFSSHKNTAASKSKHVGLRKVKLVFSEGHPSVVFRCAHSNLIAFVMLSFNLWGLAGCSPRMAFLMRCLNYVYLCF